MKVKVEYTVDVNEDYRRAINLFYGASGMATRSQVKNWLRNYGSSCDDDLMGDLAKHEELERIDKLERKEND